jgi:hypothetical protein
MDGGIVASQRMILNAHAYEGEGTMDRIREHRQSWSTDSGGRSKQGWAMRALAGGALAASLVLAVSVPASAANPSVVTDPVGDAVYKAPGYMDIVGAQLADLGGTFEFKMSVAKPVPATPPLPSPATKQISWSWPLDTDPTTNPAGAPKAPGYSAGAELIITIAWDGSAFSAFLQDRRPLLTGGQAVLTPLDYTISGTLLQVDVEANALGDPSSFGWGGVAFYWSGPFDSNNGNHFVDDLSPFYTPWPS